MKKNLLIVDDDFDTRFILKKVLENEGYDISLAQNEIETFEALAHFPINLILLDLKLGNTSGFEICKNKEQHKFFGYSDHLYHRFPVGRGHDKGYRVRFCGSDREAI